MPCLSGIDRATWEYMMPLTRLDPIDRLILAELQADGRMTNVELAKRVGISAPPCLRRVRALEEQGFINGYHAQVDARALGFGSVFFRFRFASGFRFGFRVASGRRLFRDDGSAVEHLFDDMAQGGLFMVRRRAGRTETPCLDGGFPPAV